jgi:nitroreductase / dihydropteridine reductase
LNLSQIVTTRRTTKAFDPMRKVPAATMAELEVLLRYAPSSVNVQPWHFVIASSEAGKERIARAAHGPYSANAVKIRNASHVVVFCVRRELDDAHLVNLLAQEAADGRFPTPEAKAGQSNGRNFYVNLHRKECGDVRTWMERQVYLAFGSLLLGAASLGVDACPIEGCDFALLDGELGLAEQGYASIVIACLGYRSGDDFNAALPKSRLQAETVISYL